MPHTIKVKPYQRRRPVPKGMQGILERLGITPSIEVRSHDRAFTQRRPKGSKADGSGIEDKGTAKPKGEDE